MPSSQHDALNRLIQKRPEFALEVLRDFIGVDLPANLPVTLEKSSFNDRQSTDLHADTVIVVGPPQNPFHGMIVEIQRDENKPKRRQLPRYAAALWLHLKRPVTVVVICPDSKVASAYAEPIATTLPGYVFQAAVLGPDRIPAITDPYQAATQPQLATLSVMAHGENRKVAEAFMAGLFAEGITQLSDEHATHYYEYASGMSASVVCHLLEEIMSTSTWPVYSSIGRVHYGRGKEEGKAEGEAEALLEVLSGRGLEISGEASARITACRDLGQLKIWLRRAITAESTDEIFQ